MAVNSLQVKIYANQIYLQGEQRFTARDGFTGIAEEYHPHVKQYAAASYERKYIDDALRLNWINQEEYDQTVAYIIV